MAGSSDVKKWHQSKPFQNFSTFNVTSNMYKFNWIDFITALNLFR